MEGAFWTVFCTWGRGSGLNGFENSGDTMNEDGPNLTSMPLLSCLEELLVLNNTTWKPFQKTTEERQNPSMSEASSSRKASTYVAPSGPLSKLRTLCVILCHNVSISMKILLFLLILLLHPAISVNYWFGVWHIKGCIGELFFFA